MRVALLSYNAQLHNAIGNQVAEKVRFLHEHGAEVRVFVQDTRRLHPDLHAVTTEVHKVAANGPVWEYLLQADLVIAVYAQACELWQYLPMLAGIGPRILFDYHGVTPPELCIDQQREVVQRCQRTRGYVWFADHALTASEFTRHELAHATRYPLVQTTALPLPVDAAHFQPSLGERYLQERLGIVGRILLFVGRLASNKRIPLLIEALAALADRSLHAVVVGDGSDVYAAELARCRALAETLGVAERVHFLPPVADAELARVYHSADVLVMPSLHEGFCVPVVEAMASGLPVVASRSTALPETVADAGLTFVPNEVADLARQLTRVLAPAKPLPLPSTLRVAFVSFRFGAGIVGGAETSLATMAHALQQAGHDVRVFTTCTTSESGWTNELPAGLVTLDGFRVERFPIDPHDAAAHGQTVRTILDAHGKVALDIEQRYLQQSIHSSALLAALRARQNDFDAILVGPYLFSLTVDIVKEFHRKTLLVPCFHDEALARLSIWPRVYGEVGGVLYHSREEQDYAQRVLGVNHPNAHEIGTYLAVPEAAPSASRRRVVYCGRYSPHKNVPLLLDWARRYQRERPGGCEFLFMGQGDVELPREPWLRDLGRVEPEVKRAVLANALALVQLSVNESLSLVALEAWACGTPVIVHRDCAVLRGQIERSQGGATVGDYASFAATLDDLLVNDADWRERGQRGHAYVAAKYGSAATYAKTLLDAIHTMQQPTAEQMRASGLRRATALARERWQVRFGDVLDRVLSEPARHTYTRIEIQPLRQAFEAMAGTRTLLLPIRLRNEGTQAVTHEGPGRTMIGCELIEAATSVRAGDCQWTAMPELLAPGQTQTMALPITLPDAAGAYRLRLWCERPEMALTGASPSVDVPLHLNDDEQRRMASCASTFLDTVQETLPRTQQLQQLPCDYVDVTEGRFAPVKRWVKRKLLNNFKQAYVDGLSRQQSQVNGQVVVMIQQLAECCAMLDHAVQGLHRRLDGLEAKIGQIADSTANEEIHG